jgi:hypothetical protein
MEVSTNAQVLKKTVEEEKTKKGLTQQDSKVNMELPITTIQCVQNKLE